MNPGALVGKEVSHYRVLSQLGKGAMGVVYEAEDLRLGRRVALKFVTDTSSGDARATGRFKREARAASALNHPHICSIHDIGEFEGTPFIVMECLEGESLKNRLGRKPLQIPEVIQIGAQIADGLAAAHAKGIVHRDIKPANVFLTSSGHAKIVDFGLAKTVRPVDAALPETVVGDAPPQKPPEDDMLTLPGTVLGTFAYMSPEQVLGREVDARSDVFAFGVLLYEMAVGHRPFLSHATHELRQEILHSNPAPPTRLKAHIPAGLDALISRCLAKEPANRYPSAREILDDLRRLEPAGDVTTSRAKQTKVRTSRPRKAPIDSIAVLPFENRAGDADAEYLSDGIAGSIINSLSNLTTLRVMARSSVAQFKGRSVNAVSAGSELGVRAVLTGHVLQRGQRILIDAELVDAQDGSQLWGHSYHRELTDILDVLDEVSREICGALNLKLSGDEKRRVAKHHTESSEAYELYLKGRYHWEQRTADAIRTALTYFEKAIQRDPEYALAYAGIADCHALLCFHDAAAPVAVFPKAKVAATKALELDPSLAEAHASLGMLWAIWEFEWAESEKELKRAIELKPGYATAHHWYATFLSARGQADAAVAEIRRALELEPLSPGINTDAAMVLFRARRFDEAIAHSRNMQQLGAAFGRPAAHVLGRCHQQQRAYPEAIADFRQALALAPASIGDRAYLGLALAESGDAGEANAILQDLIGMQEQRYVAPLYTSLLHLGLGRKERALDCLRRACEDRYPQVVYLGTDPVFDPIRSEPRFHALLKQIGIHETATTP